MHTYITGCMATPPDSNAMDVESSDNGTDTGMVQQWTRSTYNE